MPDDGYYMRRALGLAARGRAGAPPNPMVGCVVVKDGLVAGEGFHERCGGAHAEINALRAAGTQASAATLYVTLEPCSQYGKTPPCVDAIRDADIARVVIGADDPTQSGAAILRAAGIAVDAGVLRDECQELNRPFYKLALRHETYVVAKWAMSLDGRIASHAGHSRWISSPESRTLVHRWRSECQGIAVGIGTVLKDDPLLTARLPGAANPRRFVLDTNARTPLDCRLLKTLEQAGVTVVVADDAPAGRVKALQGAGADILALPRSGEHIDLAALPEALGALKVMSLLLEGGGSILGSAFARGMVDEVRVFIAPIIIGGEGAMSPVLGPGVDRADDAPRLWGVAHERIADDALITGYATPTVTRSA